MWGTFVLATSNMAASAIALAASSPMAPLFDRSSSTTLDEKQRCQSQNPRWRFEQSAFEQHGMTLKADCSQ